MHALVRTVRWVAPVVVLVLCVGIATARTDGEEAPVAPAGDATLEVTVHATDGTPLSDTRVEIRDAAPAAIAAGTDRPLARAPIASGTTDAEGRLSVSAPGGAAWHVRAHATGRRAVSRIVCPRSTDGPRRLAFALPPGATLSGRVVEEERRPAADATVYAGPVGFEAEAAGILAETRTAADGSFALEGLPPGPVDVWASRPGSGPRWFVRVDAAGFDDLELDFPRGAQLTGVVRDEAGNPVSGVRIRLGVFGGSWAAEAVSGPGGRYELSAFAHQLWVDRVDVGPAPWSLARVEGLEENQRIVLRTGAPREHDLVVRRGTLPDPPATPTRTTRRGRVVDASGAAVADALVGVAGSDAWTLTDAAGRFVLATIEDGSVELSVRPSQHATWTGTHAAGKAAEVAITALPRARLRVVDTDGAPVAGATVTLGDVDRYQQRAWFRTTPGPEAPRRAWTDAAGEVDLPWYAEGSVPAHVTAHGFRATTAKVTSGADDDAEVATVVLERDVPLRVRVLSGESDDGVEGAWLRIDPAGDPGAPTISALPEAQQRGPVWIGKTDARGELTVRGRADAAVRITAWHRAHHQDGADASADEEELVLRLAPHLALEGRFLRPDGTPVGGLTVSIFWVDHPEGWPCYFGPWGLPEDGSFRFPGLRAGRYEIDVLRWSEDPSAAAPAIYGPFEAGRSGLALVVHRPRTVRGRILDADGKPVAGAKVEVSPRAEFRGGVTVEAETGDDGAFVVQGASVGPIHLRMDHPSWGEGGRARRVHVWDVGDRGEEDLELAVPRGLVIGGRVRDDDGRARPKMYVVAIPVDDDGEGRWHPRNAAQTDDEGRFRIEGLTAGRYRIWETSSWRSMGGLGSGPYREPKPLDPEPGTDAGAEGVECTWRW